MTAPEPLSIEPEPGSNRAMEPPRTIRRGVLWGLGAVALFVVGLFGYQWLTYPSDRTPEGAYLRVMSAVNRGKPEAFFAYLEESAQHAAYTIRDYRRKAVEVVERTHPEPLRTELINRYRPLAEAPDGADVFAWYAKERGYVDRLRRDLSAVARIEIVGERATVETARGTRYPFRRRPNGIWGLTLFTADLLAEAERASRDLALIEKAGQDYERAARAR